MPLRLWPAVILTGIAAGISGGLLMKLLRVVQHISFRYVQGNFLSGVEAVSAERRLVVLGVAGLLAGVVLVAVRRIPDHIGPGLNEAIWRHCGDMPSRSMLVKALLSIVVVGMGAALGREAALKQFGGMLGKALGNRLSLNASERKLLIACGVGAGMAAAYNVPLGGALFTLEVLLGTISIGAVLPAFTTSFIATWVAWLMLPNEPTYSFPPLSTTPALLIGAAVSGPLLGFASILFVRGIHWSKGTKPGRGGIFAMPVLSLLTLGAASIALPQLLGNGKNVVQLTFNASLGGTLLLVMVVARPLASMLCLRAGIPGGLFTPTMTFGALCGSAFGQFCSFFGPHSDVRGFALIGSGALLASASQAPISSVVFMLELTANSGLLIVPLLLATCGATLVHRHFESRTYS